MSNTGLNPRWLVLALLALALVTAVLVAGPSHNSGKGGGQVKPPPPVGGPIGVGGSVGVGGGRP